MTNDEMDAFFRKFLDDPNDRTPLFAWADRIDEDGDEKTANEIRNILRDQDPDVMNFLHGRIVSRLTLKKMFTPVVW